MQDTQEFFKERVIGIGPLPWPARRVGLKAKDLFVHHAFSGKVLAVLSTTIYLASRDGEIFWMSQEDRPMHRRCILASFPSDSICVGQSFFTQGLCLRIAGGINIDLDQAIEWKPPAVLPEQAQPIFVVNDYVRRLLQVVVKLGNAKGFGQTILLISAALDGSEMATFVQDSLFTRVRNSILDLMRACRKKDAEQVAQIGREFVGLGPGLTPSGDDFLGGLFFTAHTLKTAYPEEFDWEVEPVMYLIDWARTQTHPISHAVFSDLALGHGPEPLHKVITSLLKGENLDHTMAGVARLVEIGDTSGWDILAGMLTGMLSFAGLPH